MYELTVAFPRNKETNELEKTTKTRENSWLSFYDYKEFNHYFLLNSKPCKLDVTETSWVSLCDVELPPPLLQDWLFGDIDRM